MASLGPSVRAGDTGKKPGAVLPPPGPALSAVLLPSRPWSQGAGTPVNLRAGPGLEPEPFSPAQHTVLQGVQLCLSLPQTSLQPELARCARSPSLISKVGRQIFPLKSHSMTTYIHSGCPHCLHPVPKAPPPALSLPQEAKAASLTPWPTLGTVPRI